MKITSDERRKIAAKLRALADGKFPMDECSVYDLYTALGMPLPRAGIEYAIIGYLADLIDPTSHKVIPSEIDGYVFCSNCGAEIGEYGVPNYCHNCGARVVSSHD